MVESNTTKSNKILVGVAALLLWLGTAAIGLWQIVLLREMAYRLYARFTTGDPDSYYTVMASWSAGTILVFLLSIVWIVMVIGGGEYHYKYVGQRRSWRLFGWIIGVQAGIFLLSLFI